MTSQDWTEHNGHNGSAAPNGAKHEVPRIPSHPSAHRIVLGDARDLAFVPDESVHLVVTSPPYFDLKQYAADVAGQLGEIHDYERFLNELDKVWREWEPVLVPGGRDCCAVSAGT